MNVTSKTSSSNTNNMRGFLALLLGFLLVSTSHATTFTFSQATCSNGKYTLSVNQADLCATTASSSSSSSSSASSSSRYQQSKTWFQSKWGQASQSVGSQWQSVSSKSSSGNSGGGSVSGSGEEEATGYEESQQEQEQEPGGGQRQLLRRQLEGTSSSSSCSSNGDYLNFAGTLTPMTTTTDSSSGGTVPALVPANYAVQFRYCHYHFYSYGLLCGYTKYYTMNEFSVCDYLMISGDSSASCPYASSYAFDITKTLPEGAGAKMKNPVYETFHSDYTVNFEGTVYQVSQNEAGETVNTMFEQCTLKFNAHPDSTTTSSGGEDGGSVAAAAVVAALLVAGGAAAYRRRKRRLQSTLNSALLQDDHDESSSSNNHNHNRGADERRMAIVELTDRYGKTASVV
ncbi:hypothetical protein ACA910_020365 [Epithemia clementina (nom. ined.)]